MNSTNILKEIGEFKSYIHFLSFRTITKIYVIYINLKEMKLKCFYLIKIENKSGEINILLSDFRK